MAFGGQGIARVDGYVVFVKDALPGQRLLARIIRTKKNYGEGLIEKVLAQSPDYTEPPCPYFWDCGGCSFQHSNYEKQLDYKYQQVRDVFAHLAGIKNVPVLPPIASPLVWGYRNKMDFSASNSRWFHKNDDPGTPSDFAIGLHAPKRFDKVLDIAHCMLQDDLRNAIFIDIREYIRSHGITLHNPIDHIGFLRNVIIRKGEYSGEIMINLVTFYEDTALFSDLVSNLTAKYPAVTSIVNNINRSWGMSSFGESEILLSGKPVIHDQIGSVKYEISANAFFQTNTRGAERLYQTIVEFADLTGREIVWDFYSGTGSIALFLADKARHIIGFEMVRDAVQNAKANAIRNNITNCQFFEADLDKFLQKYPELIKSLEPPDVAVVDPPRAGLNPKFLDQLIQLKPARIVYVSCNPATQARDIEILLSAGYSVDLIQPVDMFPHTWHIESIAKLTRR